ncbi:MAG: von Willebrand factor type A domain-containing protein [Acidobacteria bacterium]|nr:von Willebrand factor type A domain-containing protein [Acidobacteriota bacterium]
MSHSRRVFFIITLVLSLVFLQVACSSSSPSLSPNEKAVNTNQPSNNPKPTNQSVDSNAKTEAESVAPQEIASDKPANESVRKNKEACRATKLQSIGSQGNVDGGVEAGVQGGTIGGVVGGVIGSTSLAAEPPPPPPPPPGASSPQVNSSSTPTTLSQPAIAGKVAPSTSPAPQAMQVLKKSEVAKGVTRSDTNLVLADPQGSEEYTKYSINKMTLTKEDRVSTFSIDVDTGSYTIARRKLSEGYLPPAQSVRVEEFINYFQYKYPEPATEHPFSVTMEASQSPFNQERHLLKVGIKGRTVDAAQRPTAHLTFLVDTSGSMQSPDKIGLVKDSLRVLVENLRPTDTVAISTYAGGIKLVLPPIQAMHKDVILKSLYQLEAGGGTAMASGIELAYQQALVQLQQGKKGDINRVIICSDGDANIGNTNPTEILKQIEGYVKQGVTVSTIGFGMGNYKDSMMEQFANKGNGNYFYIDNLQEAKKVFRERLTSNLQVIAKDVKIQVEFDPATVAKYRLVGYENRDIADKDFRNDKVDAGEIGPGHTVTALYELELQPQRSNNIATVRLRYKAPDGEVAKEVAAGFTSDRVQQVFNKSSEDFRFTVAVAAFAEVLRGSKESRTWSLNDIASIVRGANSSKMEERQEFLSLIDRAKQLKTHLAPQQ